MAAALGADLCDTVFALVTDAFTSETVVASGSVDGGHIAGACKALNTAGAPGWKRTGVVNSDVAEALRNDEILVPYLATQEMSSYGIWQKIHGFSQILEYPSMPSNAVNLTAFFFTPEALILATRVPVSPAEMAGMSVSGYPGVLTRIVEPNSGFAVLSNLYVDAATFAVTSRLLLIFGCARGDTAFGHKFVSA